MFVFNAPTWLDEINEPDAFVLDLDGLAAFDRPALFTRGGQSPPVFRTILDKIEERLPQAQRHTFADAGHVPHLTHPAEFVHVVGGFIRSTMTARP